MLISEMNQCRDSVKNVWSPYVSFRIVTSHVHCGSKLSTVQLDVSYCTYGENGGKGEYKGTIGGTNGGGGNAGCDSNGGVTYGAGGVTGNPCGLLGGAGGREGGE